MPTTVDRCVICGDSAVLHDHKATKFLNLPDPFYVLKCNHCGLRWLGFMPTAEEYRELYEACYFGVRDSVDRGWVDEFPPAGTYEETVVGDRVPAFEARLRRLEKILPDRGTILDIGVATGEFLALARQRGWKVSGLEVSEYACERAKENYGLDVDCGELLAQDFFGKSFDVIHLNHVFEHFINPHASFEKLKSIMHEKSLLVIEVPNQFDSLVRRFVNGLRAIYGKNQMERTVYSIHHPYFYNSYSLAQILEQRGFKTISLRTYFPERWGQNLRRQVLRWLEFVADRVAQGGDNIEIIALAKPITRATS